MCHLIFSKHTNGKLVVKGSKASPGCEFPTSCGVAAHGVDIAMVCS